MSRTSRQRRAKKRSRNRKRQRAKSARPREREQEERPALLITTFGDESEMTISDCPLEAYEHPNCGRYGLRVQVVLGEGIDMQTDEVFPGCMPIAEAEKETLHALHADAAAAGAVPSHLIYKLVQPFRQVTELGQELLATAEPDSPLVEREIELAERELIEVKSTRRFRMLKGLRRRRRPQARAA
jgi:hypothetical protein